ncbi:hypothetical protein [Anaerosinus massiliensis]|uniref:hypothetical protein n=1 Tax=Massilibacillus massiliensis TaxID=1806837 RepID=UPI000DA5F91F|nr:hypothetical protein [Massilibacillus massiliensis]
MIAFLLKVKNFINDIKILSWVLCFPVKIFIKKVICFTKKNESFAIFGGELFLGILFTVVSNDFMKKEEFFRKTIYNNLSNIISINMGCIAIFFACVVIIFYLDKKYNYRDVKFRLVLKNLEINLVLLIVSILFLVISSFWISYYAAVDVSNDADEKMKMIKDFHLMVNILLTCTFTAIVSTFGTCIGIVTRIASSFKEKGDDNKNDSTS